MKLSYALRTFRLYFRKGCASSVACALALRARSLVRSQARYSVAPLLTLRPIATHTNRIGRVFYFLVFGSVPRFDVCFAYQIVFAIRRSDTPFLTQCSTQTISSVHNRFKLWTLDIFLRIYRPQAKRKSRYRGVVITL